MRVRAAAVEEISGDPALILDECAKPASGLDRVIPQPLDDGLVDHALQPAAVDRELRHLMTGIEPTLLVPDLLAVPRQVKQLESADRDLIKAVQQTDAREFAHRV